MLEEAGVDAVSYPTLNQQACGAARPDALGRKLRPDGRDVRGCGEPVRQQGRFLTHRLPVGCRSLLRPRPERAERDRATLWPACRFRGCSLVT